MESVFESLKGTPWWAYILFGYLISIGIRAMKPHTLSINKMFILPLIFLGWSIVSLIIDFRSWWDLLAWAIAVVIGYFFGGKLVPSAKKLKVDKKKLIVYMPGGPRVLIFVVSVFIVKYFFAFFQAIHPVVSVGMHIAGIIASGGITGLFIGRLRGYIKAFTDAKHQNLKKGGNPRKKNLL